MIVAKWEAVDQYRGIHPNLDLALDYVNADFLSGLQEGRTDILPDTVWCTEFSYETVTDEQGVFEAHREFLDIHLVLQGRERIEIADPGDLILLRSEPQDDYCLYEGESRHKVVLYPGDFLVVWPADAHKVKLCVEEPEPVTKVVFKIKL